MGACVAIFTNAVGSHVPDVPDCTRRFSIAEGIVTDVVMPGMGGGELATRMQSLHPEAKVLYVSGYTDEAVMRHGVLEAGSAFLQKPFTARQLMTKVRQILDA